ncbi:hypothetical protein [Terriglobus sp.]|uniref:hypothetical protein n=1 Tax=Terriglobus sp. TaxID=1889013 RepID=UPI003B00D823
MSNGTHDSQWNTYSGAWANVTPEERNRLLTQSVATNFSFSTPDTEGSGVESFTALLEKFQKQYPGSHFETRTFIEHHGQSVAEWILYGGDGSELLKGTTVARYGDDGKMTHVAGFWKI